MAKSNKLDIQIGVKVKDSPLKKLEEKLNKLKKPTENIESKLSKLTDKIKTTAVDNLNSKLSKLKDVSSKIGTGFNNLKGKINNSFPIRTLNFLKDGMKKLRGEADKTGGAFGFLKGKIGALAGTVAGFFAVSSVIGFVNSSIDNYKADLVNQTKLKSNLEIVATYKNDKATIDKVFKEFTSEASRIQSVGVYGDEMMVGAQAQLSTFQLTNKEINMLMPKIADIVANQKGLNGTAEDFFGTATMIGKAMSTGQLAPLRKVGIALSDAEMNQFKLLNTTERAAMLQGILSKNVGNVNEELAKTPAGRIQQAANAWGDMQELIGASALQVKGKFAPYVTRMIPIVEKLGVGIIDGIGTGIDFVQANMGKISSFLKSVFSGINVAALITMLKSLIVSIGNIGKYFIDIFTPVIKILAPIFTFAFNQIALFVPKIMPIVEILVKVIGTIALIGGALLILSNPITWVIAGITAIIAIINNWGAITNSIVNGIQNTVRSVFLTVVSVISGSFEQAKSIVINFVNSVTSFFGNLISKAIELGNTIKNAFKVDLKGIASGIGKFFGVGKNYTGTRSWRGGLTTVAEKGAEMIKVPGGKPFLAQSEMLLNLPQGTEIQTAESTSRTLDKMYSEKQGLTSGASINKKETKSNKINFSPVFNIYNNKGEENVENKISKFLDRYFEEKIVGMGG